MVRGRKPDPEGLKAIKGNTRRQKKPPAKPANGASAAKATPEPKSSAGKMPAWLNTQRRVQSAAAKKAAKLTGEVWSFLQPELSRLNLLKATDDPALARFCRYMAEWILYTEVIDQEGAYYTTKSPHVEDLRRPHPAFNARKIVEGALKDLGSELGLSPAARQRLMLQLAGGAFGNDAPRQAVPGELPMQAPTSQAPSPIGMLSTGGRPH